MDKPRLRITEDCWRFDFDGLVGEVWLDHADRSAWPSRSYRWQIGQTTGRSYSIDHAARAVWCLAASTSPPPPIELELGELLELAHASEQASSSEAATTIRELLLRRTGRRWSVRAGKGANRGALAIASLPSERVGGLVSAPDAALLAAVLRLEFVGPAGASVPAKLGARSRAVLAIAGLGAAELERLDYRAIKREISGANPRPKIFLAI